MVRGRAAHFFRALNDGRNGDAAQGAHQRIIVDTDDRDLLGHGNAGQQAGLQQLAGPGVGDRDDADRLG